MVAKNAKSRSGAASRNSGATSRNDTLIALTAICGISGNPNVKNPDRHMLYKTQEAPRGAFVFHTKPLPLFSIHSRHRKADIARIPWCMPNPLGRLLIILGFCLENIRHESLWIAVV